MSTKIIWRQIIEVLFPQRSCKGFDYFIFKIFFFIKIMHYAVTVED